MAVTTLLAALAPLLASRVVAQTASVTAVCTYAQWTFYKGQSPCQIWGNLQAACNSSATVPKLDTSGNPDATYPSPNGASATPCQCNVVAYNLMAGCSWCQPNVYSNNWVSESLWKGGCSSYDSSGKVPSQANALSSSIPPWALLVENGSPWEEFDASSIALAGTTPTGTAFGGIGTPTSFGFGPTGFGTATGFGAGPTFTGPFSGGDDGDGFDTNNVSSDIGKVVGITVGVILGCYLVLYAILLGVFVTRQKNRRAWYGPTAAFYRNGGRMGDIHVAQPLLGNPAQSPNPNPFGSPSPSTGSTPAQSALPYQPPSPQPAQYGPNVSYVQGYPQYQPPPTGQYDPNANYGQSYPQYHPNTPPPNAPHPGSTPHVAQV